MPKAIHNKMMELLREFLVVGGMPEVLQSYVDSADLTSVHSLQRNIYSVYVNDIARFSRPEIKIKAESCYRSIPQQLEKENHKFQYSKIEKRGTARKFESSVDWLINAHLAKCVFNVSKVEFPLEYFKKEDNFRLYMDDVGLFVSTFDISLKQATLNDTDIEKEPSNLVLKIAKGGVYEALAADILMKNAHERLYFYRNDQGNVEIDFLVEAAEGPLPLEIGKKVTIPLYMMMFV